MLQKFDYFWGLPEAHIPKPLGDIISYWILLFFLTLFILNLFLNLILFFIHWEIAAVPI